MFVTFLQVDKFSTSRCFSVTITSLELTNLKLVQKKSLGLFGSAQSPYAVLSLFGQSHPSHISAETGDKARWPDALFHFESDERVTTDDAAEASLTVEVFNAGAEPYVSCVVQAAQRRLASHVDVM